MTEESTWYAYDIRRSTYNNPNLKFDFQSSSCCSLLLHRSYFSAGWTIHLYGSLLQATSFLKSLKYDTSCEHLLTFFEPCLLQPADC